MTRWSSLRVLVVVLLVTGAVACHKKQPPIARPVPPPPPTSTPVTPPPEPPAPTPEPPAPAAPTVVPEDTIASGSLDEINKNSPLRPVFFNLDAAEIDAPGQQALQSNAELLKKYPTWQISIEGHCDERGTAEYNLALGERRAVAARTYLLSLGIAAERVKTVSYGKEFPFDPAHNEAAWSKNRRAHFVVTAK